MIKPTRYDACDATEDIGRNASGNPWIGDIVAKGISRRTLLVGALGMSALALAPNGEAEAAARSRQGPASRFAFAELQPLSDREHQVAPGYEADILIRWGDPVCEDAPDFDPAAQSADSQRRQFGYNNDFVGYLPMPGAADPSRHGLLVVNHEFTNTEFMIADYRGREQALDVIAIEMAAHGGSVVEIRRTGTRWQTVRLSNYARRIDVATPMDITGPAAGDPRMRTSGDPSGRRVLGMINNCGGGITPWGTWLSCEENFHGYFAGGTPGIADAEARSRRRYGVPGNWFSWHLWDARFDVSREPHEANRFGWIVEIDPFDPASTPKKRTALGRFKHEGAFTLLNKDGRVVVYSGDDERFEYVYRFVSQRSFDPRHPEANRDLLDHGTLSVARFDPDGTLDWLPLVHGLGPLTPANGFHSQADVVIEARRAADLLGATPMDRPEDIEASPTTQKVYLTLTNNALRSVERIHPANPRANNRFGHVVEMTPPDADHAGDRYRWAILLRCGDPSIAAVGATFAPQTSAFGWFGMPDNVAFDAQGRLWIATDGNSMANTGRSDGLWAVETEGPLRGLSRRFFSAPRGAELCGPVFTPDAETLFVAVQHPQPDEPVVTKSGAFRPSWPDFRAGMPTRPSVVAITRQGGGVIGS
ncbi:MAG: PhoX family phosphatase [Hyphomicrobiales bacterium]|nr:PhoX family phosphatase [Hyphomicrobiales bacterium]